jgi:glycosyltransferase involved in cell wall biosynthesis
MLELSLLTIYTIITIATIYCAWKLMYAFRHFTMKSFTTPAAHLSELPSVSVCVPARNETHAMTQCLESIAASTYPKLEIIVLDDASVDNTSFLIKSFAHAGVRFVEGSALPGGWLGKNHALQGLLEEASGRYILYADVDTRLQPDTIGQLVAYMEKEDAQMVSVLPQRSDGLRFSVLFSPLRYFWELVLHRQKAPATASSAWLIDRHALIESGGFSNIALDVQPEARIAATMALTDQYRFLISTPELGVSYEKKWSSQMETSIRLLYPRFGYTPWSATLAAFLLVIVWSPVPGVALGLFYGWTLVQALALWMICLFAALYTLYASRIWRRHWWTALVLWPLIFTQEIVLFLVSVASYARGTITWKGRPVRMRQASSPVQSSTSEV